MSNGVYRAYENRLGEIVANHIHHHESSGYYEFSFTKVWVAVLADE